MRPVLILLLSASPVAAADLQVGAAQTDITPLKGTPMAGYYSARGAEGTLDKLYARAIVLEKDGTKAALVSLDLIGTTFVLTKATREKIEADTGIPAGNVMLFATHTHTGPVMNEGSPFAGGGAKILSDYLADLPEKIAAAVKRADNTRQPATARRGIGAEDGLAFNRRYHMTDGTVGWNPGKLNPKIIKPAGPTDTAVPVVAFDTLAKPRPIATTVNFAMHSDTVTGLYFSADYIGRLADAVDKARGSGHVTAFGLGACGDVNHIDTGTATRQGGELEATRIGTRLAGEVLRTFDKMQPVGDGPLKVSSLTVELPLAPVTAEQWIAAKTVVKLVADGAKPAPAFLDQVQAFKATDVTARLGKPLAVEVQVITLGDDLAWVSLPGEIFVELGLSIQHGSPFPQTMVHTLANGSIGYVPTKRAYSEGNYEVISARCAEGGGELLVAAALKQLRGRKKR